MKRGQITIWVILAIVLFATTLIVFFLIKDVKIDKPYETDSVFDLESILNRCAEMAVNEAVDLMLPHGGFINPENTVFFNNTHIAYLCVNNIYYDPCILQHPALLNEIKQEIKNYVTPIIEGCFEDIEREFESSGAVVDFIGGLNVDVDLGKDRVFLDIQQKTNVRKSGESRIFENINIEITNPIYNLATLGMEIASQESSYCYFEFIGYNALYPRYKIRPDVITIDLKSVTIYSITDTKSGKIMNIAISSCSIPPGGF